MQPISLENFLGRSLEIPADFNFDPEQNLWARRKEPGLVEVGFAEPLVLSVGGIKDLEPLVDDGAEVGAGDTVMLAITAKIRYLYSPLGGKINFRPDLAEAIHRVAAAPYDTPLFTLAGADIQGSDLADARGYAKFLSRSEGARNPGGHTGGVSPTCKAVYQGISDQRLTGRD